MRRGTAIALACLLASRATAADKDSGPQPSHPSLAGAHWVAKRNAPQSVKDFIAHLAARRGRILAEADGLLDKEKTLLAQAEATERAISNEPSKMVYVGAGESETDENAESDRDSRYRKAEADVKAARKALSEGASVIASARSDPAWLPVSESIGFSDVGEIGKLTATSMTVLQVIDSKDAIIRIGDDLCFWVKGIDFSRVVDDSPFVYDDTVIVSGTKQYTNALGALHTIYCVEPLPLKGYIELMRPDGTVFDPNSKPVPYEKTDIGKIEMEKLQDAKSASDKARNSAIAVFQKSSDFAQLVKAIADADDRRTNSEGQSKLDASHDFLAARQAMDTAQGDFVANDRPFMDAFAAYEVEQKAFDEQSAAYAKNPEFASSPPE